MELLCLHVLWQIVSARISVFRELLKANCECEMFDSVERRRATLM
jgi:hypothetical protein